MVRKKKTLGANMFKQESKLTKDIEDSLHHRLLEERRFQLFQDKQKLQLSRADDL